MEHLHLNGIKLLWTNDIESLKNFVESVLEQQGKWLTPGRNTKQFKSSNSNLIINWYNKKQTVSFQGRNGPALRDKLVLLHVAQKPGTTADLQDPDPLVSLLVEANSRALKS